MAQRHPEQRPLLEMIGRRSDLAALARLATDPDVRLVTVCGAGGIGKTRLAQELICTVADDFADGAHFVDLVPVNDARLLAERIAASLGLPLPDSGGYGDAVIRHLADQNMLLVLDNLEHLLEGTPFVQNLAASAPDLVIVITSRQRLAIPGEHVFELTPLGVPAQQGISSLESIGSSDAVQLFVRRAQAADRTFALTNDNALDIAAICRRLDGLPLAIELAASRVTEIPPHLILRNFVRILPFLERSSHDPDGRHRTMRNAISWSFESLPPEEQTLFARLSVFQSGFTLDGARAVGMVATPEPLPIDPDITLLRRLASLVSRHLLVRRAWNADEPRYDMLQTMREFGLERLAEMGEERDARDAHAAYLIELAERLRQQLVGPDPAPAVASYNTELDEFRAALTWLTTSRPTGDLDAIRLCNALSRFWLWAGHSREGTEWYLKALAQAPEHDSLEFAAAYLNLGHFRNDDLLAAQDYYQRSYDMLQRLGEVATAAGLLSSLGMTAQSLGNLDEAERYLLESLRVFEELEHDQGIGHVSHLLGTLAGSRGNFVQATAYLDRARNLADQHGDVTNAIFSLVEMARFHRINKRNREAEQLLRWSLARLDKSGIEHTRGMIHADLGMIALANDDLPAALEEFRVSIRQALDTSMSAILGLPITGMARLASLAGKNSEAIELLAGIEHWLELSGYGRDAGERALADETSMRASSAIGRNEADLAWKRGMLRSIEETAAVALSLPLAFEKSKASTTRESGKSGRFHLTKQELKVLCRMASGEKNQQIADGLFISNRTVAVHVQNILRKLDAENRTHASALAHIEGICAPDVGGPGA